MLESIACLRFLPAADFSGAPPPLVVKLLDNGVSPNNEGRVDVTMSDPIAPYSTEVIPLTTEVTEFSENLYCRFNLYSCRARRNQIESSSPKKLL